MNNRGMDRCKVVIPEDTSTGQSLWKSMRSRNEMPEIFPGFGDVPRGILGDLDTSVEDAVYKESIEVAKEAGFRYVRLSNGWQVMVPEADLRFF